MHAHAIDPEEGCLCGGDPYHVIALWRAITGGRGGEGGPYRGRHHRHHHQPPPWARGGFGGLGPFGDFPGGRGGPFRRGRKARRGDIRTAALLLLAEEPRNGYQIMQELQERTEGIWRPSPGSVYPALQQLEDEGLIASKESDGRKLFQLTDAGRAYLRERDPSSQTPWEEMSSGVSEGRADLGSTFKEVAFAFAQVMRTGSEAQAQQASKVLATARRDLYRILADGEVGGEGGDDRGSEGDVQASQTDPAAE